MTYIDAPHAEPFSPAPNLDGARSDNEATAVPAIGNAGEVLDCFREGLVQRRQAIEESHELVVRHLYPKLWGELRYWRALALELEEQLALGSAPEPDAVPTPSRPDIATAQPAHKRAPRHGLLRRPT